MYDTSQQQEKQSTMPMQSTLRGHCVFCQEVYAIVLKECTLIQVSDCDSFPALPVDSRRQVRSEGPPVFDTDQYFARTPTNGSFV